MIGSVCDQISLVLFFSFQRLRIIGGENDVKRRRISIRTEIDVGLSVLLGEKRHIVMLQRFGQFEQRNDVTGVTNGEEEDVRRERRRNAREKNDE